MFCQRNSVVPAIVFALGVGLVACDQDTPITEPASDAVMAPDFGMRGALSQRGKFIVPFPPKGRDPAKIIAPCLDLDDQPVISGIWTIYVHKVTTPNGRVHFNEQIDYAETSITAGDLKWVAAPGARESITINNLRGAAAGAEVRRHEFHARYLSQDGLPDLKMAHRIKIVIGPNGDVRHFVPPSFPASCIGRSS